MNKVKIVTVVDGDPKAPFSLSLIVEGATPRGTRDLYLL